MSAATHTPFALIWIPLLQILFCKLVFGLHWSCLFLRGWQSVRADLGTRLRWVSPDSESGAIRSQVWYPFGDPPGTLLHTPAFFNGALRATWAHRVRWSSQVTLWLVAPNLEPTSLVRARSLLSKLNTSLARGLLAGWLVACLVVWLVGCLIHWLAVGWLAGWLALLGYWTGWLATWEGCKP